jgi:hypothetical protein
MEWPGRVSPRQRVSHWLGRNCLALSGFRCLDSWGQIARELKSPRSILCLGNGPSSEDPALGARDFDCVLRVNWVWHARAKFAAPAIVFTADRDPPPAGALPLIAFPTRADAHEVLALYRAEGRMLSAYFVMAELPSALNARDWPLRPTNGAMMIAAAAQLNPARLAIAGIDLYQHPDGKYPGDSAETNDYDAIHSRDNDLTAIALALRLYPGELTVIGDALRGALPDTLGDGTART